ncbi:MAG TPA: HemK2/MTQ2 family protein methyltransferase [Gaiellales bacterium]|jgi:release factor glutamine methyltransferase
MLTRFRDLRLVTPPGVFAPRSDAGVLLDAALPRLRGDVLDLCSGSGVLALAAAPHAATVLAVDMSRLAAGAIRVNALVNRRRVEVRRGDLFAAVGSRRFDVILSNPPYVPTPPGAKARLGSAAWEGGPRGRDLLDRICAGTHEHLRPGGEVLIVQSALADIERTLELLGRSGLTVVVVAAHQGPYGSIVRSRLDYLEAAGLVHDRNEPERVVVISGVRAAAPARPATAAR